MSWTVLATALVLMAPFGAEDPDIALKEINTYRTTTINEARQSGKAIDSKALSDKTKEMALKAIDGVKPMDIDPAKGYSWMQLFAMAGEYKDIEMLCMEYMKSKPAPAGVFSAELMCLSACNQLGEFVKGADKLSAIQPPDEASAMTLASYATAWFAEPLAEKKGVDAAMKFLDSVMAKLPASVSDEKVAPRLASAVASLYESKGEILIAHGKKEAGLKAFEDGMKDPRIPEASARSLKYAGIRAGMIGSPPPAIPFTEKYGNFTSLSDMKGKVVMVDFMAHWCGPCIAAFPSIRKLYDDHKSDGLEILSVTRYYGYFGQEKNLAPADEFAKMEGFMSQYKMNWPMAFTSNDTFGAYGITGIPTMAIIGKDGTVRKLHVGFSEQSFEEVKTLVAKLLKE